MTHGDDEQRESKGILHYLGLGLSLGVLAIVVGLAALLIVVPKLAGATPLTVLTQSMEPKLPPGSLIVVKPVAPKDIRVGDVITYQIKSGDPAVISHRVIGVTSASDGTFSFTTKGDNNEAADPTVIEAQVKGRLWYSFPFIGYVNNAVNGDARSWIVPVLAMGLFGYAAFMIISGIIISMRKRREDAEARGDAATAEATPDAPDAPDAPDGDSGVDEIDESADTPSVIESDALAAFSGAGRN